MKDENKKIISLLNELLKKVNKLEKTLNEHADQLDHVHWLINMTHYYYYRNKKGGNKTKIVEQPEKTDRLKGKKGNRE